MTSILIHVRSKPIEFRANDVRVNLSGGLGRFRPKTGHRFWNSGTLKLPFGSLFGMLPGICISKQSR